MHVVNCSPGDHRDKQTIDITDIISGLLGVNRNPRYNSVNLGLSPSAFLTSLQTSTITAQSEHNGQPVTCEAYTEDPEFSTYVNQTTNVKCKFSLKLPGQVALLTT